MHTHRRTCNDCVLLRKGIRFPGDIKNVTDDRFRIMRLRSTFLAYFLYFEKLEVLDPFPYFKKLKVGLCDLHAVCL
jgi:hypothetical protein